MFKENIPFLSDEFLDELAKEISQLYGDHTNEQNAEHINNGLENNYLSNKSLTKITYASRYTCSNYL